jgi:excisionase family DNA binding protein
MARRKSTLEGPTYYTTYQVAKFLGVSLPTVVNWVKSGHLRAHRTPGGHRRIAHTDVVSFAQQNHYPLHELAAPPAKRRKVLVVDDEPDFAHVVKEYLALKGGLEVEVAESGFQAGYTVARFRPDLILLDLMMPDMDGFEVHRMLRADPETHRVPVIACTAYRDPVVDGRLREQPFDGFIEKPLELEALLRIVQAHLQRADTPVPAPA